MLQLYTAIWRVSGPRQIVLILLSIAVAALAAVPLSYQKDIINALDPDHVQDATLFHLGMGMMAMILISLGLKWILGFRSGVLGEDIIRLLRKRLYHRTYSKTAQPVPSGTLTTAVSAEAEELGKFAGAAFSEPVVQIGTLISVIGYIAANQPRLGAIVLVMIIPQILLVLMTQKKVNSFVANRVHLLRRSSNVMVQSGSDSMEQSVLDDFDVIFQTRRHMFVWKLSTKFLISAINGFGLVAVLMVGGWLVMQGRSDVGMVVAATIGLGRIQGPTAFLIAFYRQVSATRVKYDLIIEILDTKHAHPSAETDIGETLN